MKYRTLTPLGSFEVGTVLDGSNFADAEYLARLIENRHLEPADDEATEAAKPENLELAALKSENEDFRAKFARLKVFADALPVKQQKALKDAVNGEGATPPLDDQKPDGE